MRGLSRRAVRTIAAAAVLAAVGSGLPTAVNAIGDPTPPIGTVDFLGNDPTFHLAVSTAITGQLVTVTPVFASDFPVASDDQCDWELRWANLPLRPTSRG